MNIGPLTGYFKNVFKHFLFDEFSFSSNFLKIVFTKYPLKLKDWRHINDILLLMEYSYHWLD